MTSSTSHSSLETIAEDLVFPEGPVVLRDGSFLVVEIGARCLTRIRPDGSKERMMLGGGPNGAAIGPDGAVYICNNGGSKILREDGLLHIVGASDDYAGGSIQRVDLATGAVRTLYTECGGHRLSAPNDLVFDRQGGFYFTDIGKTYTRDRDRGGLYYAQPDGSRIEEVAFPLHTPNGIGLSPDESTLYTAETETCRLWAYRILAPGRLEILPAPSPNGGRIVFGAGAYQRFDSLKVERDGRVSVATLNNGGITTIDPGTGTALHTPMPDMMTTNLCFGGPDHRTAYITLSTTGRLVRCPWPRAGLPLNFEDRA